MQRHPRYSDALKVVGIEARSVALRFSLIIEAIDSPPTVDCRIEDFDLRHGHFVIVVGCNDTWELSCAPIRMVLADYRRDERGRSASALAVRTELRPLPVHALGGAVDGIELKAQAPWTTRDEQVISLIE